MTNFTRNKRHFSFILPIGETKCSDIRRKSWDQKCDFIRETHDCNEEGLVRWKHMLYCDFQPGNEAIHWIYIGLFIILCIYLFVVLAKICDNFFCPALKAVAKLLHLNESVAGVTLLAFGNSIIDFCTIPVHYHSTQIRIGQLLTAVMASSFFVAIFVTGLILVISPSVLTPSACLRDILFLLFLVVYIDYLSEDDFIHTRNAIGVILVYFVYIIVIVIEQILMHYTEKKMRKELEKALADETMNKENKRISVANIRLSVAMLQDELKVAYTDADNILHEKKEQELHRQVKSFDEQIHEVRYSVYGGMKMRWEKQVNTFSEQRMSEVSDAEEVELLEEEINAFDNQLEEKTSDADKEKICDCDQLDEESINIHDELMSCSAADNDHGGEKICAFGQKYKEQMVEEENDHGEEMFHDFGQELEFGEQMIEEENDHGEERIHYFGQEFEDQMHEVSCIIVDHGEERIHYFGQEFEDQMHEVSCIIAEENGQEEKITACNQEGNRLDEVRCTIDDDRLQTDQVSEKIDKPGTGYEPGKSGAEEEMGEEEEVVEEEEVMEEEDEEVSLCQQFKESVFQFDREQFKRSNYLVKAFTILMLPTDIFFKLIIPVVDLDKHLNGWSRLLNSIHIATFSLCLVYYLGNQNTFYLKKGTFADIPLLAITIPWSIFASLIVFFSSSTKKAPRYHVLHYALAVGVSMFFIYLIAATINKILEVVSLATTLTQSFIDCTVVAFGNSIGHLVSNLQFARDGYQKMAFGACFGGPIITLSVAFGIALVGRCLIDNGGMNRYEISSGSKGKNCIIFLTCGLLGLLFGMVFTNFIARRSLGIFLLVSYLMGLLTFLLSEFPSSTHPVIHPYGTDHAC